MNEAKVLTDVYVWQNGQVMAFDQFGQQMPEFQGRKDEVWDKLQAARRPETKISGDCVWPATERKE